MSNQAPPNTALVDFAARLYVSDKLGRLVASPWLPLFLLASFCGLSFYAVYVWFPRTVWKLAVGSTKARKRHPQPTRVRYKLPPLPAHPPLPKK